MPDQILHQSAPRRTTTDTLRADYSTALVVLQELMLASNALLDLRHDAPSSDWIPALGRYTRVLSQAKTILVKGVPHT